MRNVFSLLGVVFAISVSGFTSAGPSDWNLQAISQSTGYTVNGQVASGHQFGMLKHSNICAKDELYLTWSSRSPNVWSLSGQRVNVLAEFDGTPLTMPLEVVSIRELPGRMHQVMFAHVYANAAVVDLIAQSRNVKITMPQDNPHIASIFSVTQDNFSLPGFLDARNAAHRRCSGLSDNVVASAQRSDSYIQSGN